MKASTLTASIVAAILVATFSRQARADWTWHLDGGGGWSSAHGASGELAARFDGVIGSFARGKAGIGPAAEMHVLTPKAGIGLVGVWRGDDNLAALTSTLIYGYDGSDDGGAYVAGTVALGLRVAGYHQTGWAPSSAAYLSIGHRLDGSDDQVVLGVQVGLGLTYFLLHSIANAY